MVAIQRQRQEKVTTSPTAVDSSVTHRLLMMAVRYTSWWGNGAELRQAEMPVFGKRLSRTC